MDDSGLPAEKDFQLHDFLREEIAKNDLVITADFGHGAISEGIRQVLIDESPFLTINTQANAGKGGFHTVNKYSRADYASIAGPETKLKMHDIVGKIKPMMDVIASKMDCTHFVVTRGKKGCIVRSRDGAFIEIPAFAQKVVDRIGAGDAFFSITALASYLDAFPEFIGKPWGRICVSCPA